MNLKTKWHQPLLLFYLLFSIISAQVNDIQFERLSIESGLSQSSVLCIYQDHEDFLWFGTYEGLNRYDGYTFKVYRSNPEDSASLSHNHIAYITEDYLGNLWIGTQGGLNLFDRKKEQFIHFKNDPNDPTSLGHDYVRYIYEDHSDVLWIGTHGGGLNKFDREKKSFVRYLHDPDNPSSISDNNVLSICEDSQGKLWVGTDGGLNCFDCEKGEFIHYTHDPDREGSISHDGIWRVYEDRKKNLWIGTWSGGLDLFDRKTNRFSHYIHYSADPSSIGDNVIRSIFEDSHGNLWIGTETGGLNLYQPPAKGKGKGHFIHYMTDPNDPFSLSSNSIFSIYEDRSGIIWLGTNFGGINKYNPGKRKFTHYRSSFNDPNGLNSNSVLYVYEDSRGIIWIGTNGGGLNRFDRKNNTFKHFIHDPQDARSISNNGIRTICEDRYNRLWVGTDFGLNRYDPERNKFIRYIYKEDDPKTVSYTNIWSLLRDRDGNLWIGTVMGLNRLDYKTETFVRYLHDPDNPSSISGNFIWDIYQDKEGIFWIGTDAGGLNRFDAEKGIFTHYTFDPGDQTTICDNKILSIFGDASGQLWFGTPRGLNKFDRVSSKFTRYGEKNGLPSNVIQGILKDDHGNLWISTNKGLSKFNPLTGEVKNYYRNDGLQSNEFGANTCCRLKSGEMIFGGINGFNLFHPDSIRTKSAKPSVVITDFKIFNKPFSAGDKIGGRVILSESITESNKLRLSYKDNVFSFEFAALHYASPEDNLYAYMMEGFDKDWNYTSADRRFASYTNLPGGTYTFRVKASNNDQVWNEEGCAVAITITPPFWERAWFRVLAVIVILMAIYTIYKIRIRNIEAHKRELEIMVDERTQQLSEKADELERSYQDLAISKREMENIMQNVKEGFFLLDQQFQISSQYSAALESIFSRKDLANINFLEFLEDKIPENEINTTKSYLDILFNNKVDENMIASLNPLEDREFIFEGNGTQIIKYLNFHFKKILDKTSKKIELIVTVRDVTKQVLLSIQLKAEEARREKLLQLILSILDVEPSMLSDFNESAKRELGFIEMIMNRSAIDDYSQMLVKIFRAVHLVKGNARLLKIDYFGEQAHQFEDMIAAVQKKSQITDKDINPLRQKLRELQAGIEEMEKIIEKLGQVVIRKDRKGKTDTRSLFQSLENLINSFSSDLGKKIKFDYKKFKSNIIPEKYHLLVKEVLIQLVRNSISHGIEQPEERRRLKKPKIGTIEISTFTRNGSVGFRYRDDGRGLQIEKLKERAIQSGKWQKEVINSWNEQQVADLIFASGITTSDKVDMIAGRGVGMDSVRYRIEEHQGEIRVYHAEGKYCEFEVTLPVT